MAGASAENESLFRHLLERITRAALLTVVLGISVVVATGCASTGTGVSAN